MITIRFITDYGSLGRFIGAVTPKDTVQYLKLIKEAGKICIKNKDYQYVDDTFEPTFDDAHINCVDVVVREMNYEE